MLVGTFEGMGLQKQRALRTRGASGVSVHSFGEMKAGRP